MQLIAARILLTGATGGLGQALARVLSRQGAKLLVAGREPDRLAALAAGLGAGHASVRADLNAAAGIAATVDAARAFGVNVLINNAGVGAFGLLENQEWVTIERVLATNLEAPIHLTHALLPWLKAQPQAAIVNIGSTFGSLPFPGFAAYSAAKAGISQMTRSMALELGPHGIRANAICPGSVNGPRIDRVIEAEAAAKGMTEDAVRHGYASGTAMKRLTDPEDVAHLALYLASDGARMISGQALAVDGMTYNVDP